MKIKNQSTTLLHGVDKELFNIPSKNDYTENQKAQQWRARIYAELQNTDYRHFFLTLTYDDAHLPHEEISINANKYSIECFSVNDIQLFLKRLRKALCPKGVVNGIRYFICSEYGKTTHRPHYHIELSVRKDLLNNLGLQFVAPPMQSVGIDTINIPLFLDIVQKSWSLGYVMPNKDTTPVDNGLTQYWQEHDFHDKHGILKHYYGVEIKQDKLASGCAYVSKYITKDDSFYSIPHIHEMLEELQNKQFCDRYINQSSVSQRFFTNPEQYDEDSTWYFTQVMLRKQLRNCLPFHRQSIGFGLALINDYSHLIDVNGKDFYCLNNDITIDKLNRGVFVGHKSDNTPQFVKMPQYIYNKLFYTLTPYQYGDGTIKYYRVKNSNYIAFRANNIASMISQKATSIYRKFNQQNLPLSLNTPFCRVNGLTLDSYRDTLENILDKIPVDGLENKCYFSAMYHYVYRDVMQCYPVKSVEDAIKYANESFTESINHLNYPSFALDNIVSETTTYNENDIFKGCEELLNLYDDMVEFNCFTRYQKLKQTYEKNRAYKKKVYLINH